MTDSPEDHPPTKSLSLASLADEWPETASYVALFDDISGESERGAVLVSAAALDDALLLLLRRRLQSGKATEALLTGRGPLATFSSRIDAALATGSIRDDEHALLGKMRRIRNDLAHVGGVRFTDQSLRDRCLSLKAPWGAEIEVDPNPARHYVLIAQLLLLFILVRAKDGEETRITPLETQPRRREDSVIEKVELEISVPDFGRQAERRRKPFAGLQEANNVSTDSKARSRDRTSPQASPAATARNSKQTPDKMRTQLVKLHLGMVGLTITEFADSIGYSRSTVSNVIAGRKRNPDIEAAIAERTGFRINDLWPTATAIGGDSE